MSLLRLAAHALAYHGDETAFRILPELLVAGGFLTDDEPSAVVARVEPFRRRDSGAIGAVEPHPRPHFDERSALRQFWRFLVFDPNQGNALIVLENTDGTDGYCVSGFGLANRPPIPGGEHHQADYYRWRKDHGGEDDQGFLQRLSFRKRECNETLSSKKAILSTGSGTWNLRLARDKPVVW